MKIKILYRKNLKMSPGKLAAQCVHAAIGLGCSDPMMSVIVLGVSDKRFLDTIGIRYHNPLFRLEKFYIQVDAGYTEVPPNTRTCIAFYE